jgi:hypothetical protein
VSGPILPETGRRCPAVLPDVYQRPVKQTPRRDRDGFQESQRQLDNDHRDLDRADDEEPGEHAAELGARTQAAADAVRRPAEAPRGAHVGPHDAPPPSGASREYAGTEYAELPVILRCDAPDYLLQRARPGAGERCGILGSAGKLNRPAFDAHLLSWVNFMPSKYDPETRAKAVRLVLEHRDDYPSEWAAITAVSKTGDERRDIA